MVNIIPNIIPEREEESTYNMNNSHDFIEYSKKTREKYKTMPTEELQKIVEQYEDRGLALKLIAPRTEKINHDIADDIIKTRKALEKH